MVGKRYKIKRFYPKTETRCEHLDYAPVAAFDDKQKAIDYRSRYTDPSGGELIIIDSLNGLMIDCRA